MVFMQNTTNSAMSLYPYTHEQWSSLPQEGDSATGGRIWSRITREIKARSAVRTVIRVAVAVSAAAAAVVLGVFLGRSSAGVQPVPERPTYIIASADGASTLPDGTKVWLESGSRLRYDESFMDERVVCLEGNASFNVTTTEDRALFTVRLEDAAEIEVHGTSFSVQQDTPEEIIVTLYEGAVDFIAGSSRYSLEPMKRLIYNRNSAAVSTRPFFNNINWKGGSYRLENVPLETLVDFIRWKYNVQVYVSASAREKEYRLTGTIGHDEPAENVIDKVCYVMGLSYRMENGAYRLFTHK